VQGVLAEIGAGNPALAEELLDATGPGGQSAVDQLLATQFGSCNFNALPTGGSDPILGLPTPGSPLEPLPGGPALPAVPELP
jgi:hypothetical protein